MIIKKTKDHFVKMNPLCGEIREILRDEYEPMSIAIAMDIGPTTAHYHESFDEIYFMLDGTMTLKIYNPQADSDQIEKLGENELCVITKGVHHKIEDSSDKNRLCAICCPPFNPEDEHVSDKI
jgi:mannose-6-phosphate isomerase-like protein (cupin superfamily)